MLTDPVLPFAGKFSGVSVAVAVHFPPLCVTAMTLPSMVSAAVRAEKLFWPAKISIVAGPVPLVLVVIESHGALETAVQEHPLGKTRLMFRSPPPES
jgi:hypothetical protein